MKKWGEFRRGGLRLQPMQHDVTDRETTREGEVFVKPTENDESLEMEELIRDEWRKSSDGGD